MNTFKKKLITFVKNLQFLFRPSYWFMNCDYDDVWDAQLNHLLDTCPMIIGDNYVAYFVLKNGNRMMVWTKNHPYASFTRYADTYNVSGRPSRLTIVRARKAYRDAAISELLALTT